MKTLIVVPARYGSTRFPGKPLVEIAGRSMVSRVSLMARQAAELLGDAAYVVATDDPRIEEHCKERDIPVVQTAADLPSGTDRALAAADALGMSPNVVVNLQGDAPFTPPAHVLAVAEAAASPETDAATPYVRLSWHALDELRAHKIDTPFSGTTLTCDPSGKALWFSKNIIPAIRKEDALRKANHLSPIYRHIGLYAYKLESLKRYVSLPEGYYEQLEGLEQLRLLENGMTIRCVRVEPASIAIPGIDTPEDVKLAERLITQFGDPQAGL